MERDAKTVVLERAIERGEAALRRAPALGNELRCSHEEVPIARADLEALVAAGSWRVAFVQGQRSVARDG